MRTTLLNATVWLLAATALAGAIGTVRGWDARRSVETLVRSAAAWPVLVLLLAMSAAGLGSRAVLGFLAPGAYAEEVAAARSFLEARQLYGADPRQQLGQWAAESSLAVPWGQLPGITPCHASTLTDRARFFTNHAHTPMLLLAGVPIVKIGGGRALYVILLLASLVGIFAIVSVLLDRAGVAWQSRPGLLLLAAVAGWQPVLAGIRQGDAVLPVAALVVLAWHWTRRRQRAGGAAVAAGLAACLALPAAGVLLALMRSSRRAGALALLVFLSGIGVAVAVAGAGIFPVFLQTAVETARTYAYGTTNYAVFGRGPAAGLPAVILLAGMAVLAAIAWLRGRSVDAAFAACAVLGLLFAPIVWSQHLAMVLVPAAVLFDRVVTRRSSLSLIAWALLMLVFSLPDASASWFSEMLPLRFPGGILPVLSLALLVLWGWVIAAADARSSTVLVADAVAASR